MKSRLITSLVLASVLASCESGEKKGTPVPEAPVVTDFKSSLQEKQLGTSEYYISVPAGYSVKAKPGPDFAVYYISPADTVTMGDYYGGIFFGSLPNLFPPDSATCSTEKSKHILLGDSAEWTIYQCGPQFTVQTILDGINKDEPNLKIHAFGKAISGPDMQKLMDVYSTLRRKEDK